MTAIRLLELLILLAALAGFAGLLLRRNLFLKVLAMDVTGSALVAVELALRGHLSPGGGFAAGVAGGTAIGLQLISGAAERSERLFRRYRADLLEKVAVLGFLQLALLALLELTPAKGQFGTLLSGGWIPLLNLLVGVKVTLGSWAMVQRLVRHRGLL
jgi:multicomponent Na+:H+ antiporter subunit B